MLTANLTRATLPNGMQVILRENHAAPVASFWVFYRVGSRRAAPVRPHVRTGTVC